MGLLDYTQPVCTRRRAGSGGGRDSDQAWGVAAGRRAEARRPRGDPVAAGFGPRHCGYPEHDLKVPNRPCRSTMGRPHSGHFSSSGRASPRPALGRYRQVG